MRHTLEGQAGGGSDGLATLDFTRSAGGRAGSQAAERRRYLEALARCCQVGAVGLRCCGACASGVPAEHDHRLGARVSLPH